MARRVALLISAFTAAALALTGCAESSVSTDGPLIRLGAQGMTGENAAAGMPAKDMLWYPVEYSYIAGPGLRLDAQPGHIYKVAPQGDPEKVAAKIAAAFGVKGEVERIEESWPMPMPMPATDGSTATSDAPLEQPQKSVYYHVGSKDWTGPYVQLYWNGSANWFFNNPQAYGSPSVGCAFPGAITEGGQSSPGFNPDATPAPDVTTDEAPRPMDCVYEPQLPKNLPSEESARTQAVRLFTATGLTVSPSDVKVRADQWGVSATASLKVDGQPVAIEWTISWGDGGVISSAAGHAVSVVDMGTFDTISDRDAVKRLGDWRWYGSPASSWYPAFDAPVAIMNDRALAGNGAVSGGSAPSEPTQMPPDASPLPVAPTDPSVIAPAPTAEPVEPQKITVVLEKSSRALLMIFDRDGQMWLVPGFVFESADGGVHPVVAVADGIIELPAEVPFTR